MYNRVVLIGNITRDIELRHPKGSTAVAKTGIATNRKFKKQNGGLKDETMSIDLIFFDRGAEFANQYLHKGSRVLIEGRLVLDQWTSKHSITVEEMKMLDSLGASPQGEYNAINSGENDSFQNNSYNTPQVRPAPQQSSINIDPDDIPF